MKIYLRYHRVLSKGVEEGRTDDYVSDCLIGWVEIKKKGTVVESTYAHRYMYLPYDRSQLNFDTYSIYLHSNASNTPNCEDTLTGAITDYSNDSNLQLVYAEVQNNGTEIKWQQHYGGGSAPFTGNYNMTLPAHFTLVKQ